MILRTRRMYITVASIRYALILCLTASSTLSRSASYLIPRRRFRTILRYISLLARPTSSLYISSSRIFGTTVRTLSASSIAIVASFNSL